MDKRLVLRLTNSNCFAALRRLGLRKTVFGLRPLHGFSPPQFGQGSLLRNVLLPAQTVSYLERYVQYGQKVKDILTEY
jgi:hypothetical protein